MMYLMSNALASFTAPFIIPCTINDRATLILKNFQKLPMDTQGFPCVTLTKRYDLVWDSGGAV